MLPIYLSYFAGGDLRDETRGRRRSVVNAAGFVLGFTIVFVLLGAATGTFGQFIRLHQTALNLVGGAILVLFGLNYMDVLRIGFLNRTVRFNRKVSAFSFPSSVLFGFIFSIGWTPCIGAFLGSALLLAANSQQALRGILLLLVFSLGLGIPFMISAVLIGSLKQAFSAIKRHYRVIRIVSGLLLISIGVLMMLGRLHLFLSLLTFR